MNIKILSDSTCDLGHALAAEYNVTLVPLTVVKGDQQFKDGITITPADIYSHVAAGGDLCSTAAVSVGEYEDLFAAYSKEYDGIIHITIGSNFSACYQNACLAAEEFPNVRVVDSRSLSTGQGQVVLKACQLAKTAQDLDILAADIRHFTEKVEISFLLDRLDYMAKGGRCSMVTALGANLLNLKPCIEVRDGKMSVVKKYRGGYTKCLSHYLQDRLAGREDLDRNTVFITNSPVPEGCHQLVHDAIREAGGFSHVYETETGCTVSCHCGPGTLGIILVRK